MKRFCIGDIHGSYKALIQCFEKSQFNYNQDLLVVIGDVVDGWSQTKECIEELLKIKNLVFVRGNHDGWFLDWCLTATPEFIWTSQGGQATIDSYGSLNKVPQSHVDLIQNSKFFYLLDNKLFVHGGIMHDKTISDHSERYLSWDRSLISNAIKINKIKGVDFKLVENYDEVFIGHTSTVFWNSYEPIHACNVWDLDTGAGWEGKLTIINLDTKQYWQSDMSQLLYPEYSGRR